MYLWYSMEQPFLESSLLKNFLHGDCRLYVLTITARTSLRLLPKLPEQLLFKILGNCFKFKLKLLLCLCFPCSFSFKKYTYIYHKFCTWFLLLFDEKLSNDLEITKFLFQDHAISWVKFEKICVIIFRKMFPSGLNSVNKISHKTCFTSSHNDSQTLRNNLHNFTRSFTGARASQFVHKCLNG